MQINSSRANYYKCCFWFHGKSRFENRVQLMCFVSDRGFRQYRQCVRPIKHTCPLGTDVMYGYDSRLRTYLLKLDFICRVHKTGMYPMCTHAGTVHRHANIATLHYKHRDANIRYATVWYRFPMGRPSHYTVDTTVGLRDFCKRTNLHYHRVPVYAHIMA